RDGELKQSHNNKLHTNRDRSSYSITKSTMVKAAADDVIGIDLGTTFSCVAVAIDGRIEVIANDQGNRITPSSVAFSKSSELFVGEAAKNQAAMNARNTIFDVKRLVGKKFEDEEVQRDMKYLPYSVVNKDGKPYVEFVGNDVVQVKSPEEISAMVLTKMKETAESYLGKPVAGAVVTVPAYFNDLQRQATKEAGRMAGLNVLRIINEPTAGALAYGLGNQRNASKRKILVYDLGGGTLDVSVMAVEDDVFEVLAVGGDTHLGGGDFDQRVMDYFVQLIKEKHGKDISRDARALGKLRKECERAKRSLSNQSEVKVEIEYFLEGGNDFSELLTRAKFEKLNMDLFKKTLDTVTKTLEDGKVNKTEIKEIVLVGGSTRIPKVREMLKEMFDGKEASQTVNPDEAVAIGAALLGAKLSGKTSAVQGFTLIDVTPLSSGYKVIGDLMKVVIPKNTAIPVKKSVMAGTSYPRQTAVDFTILQGERSMSKDCLQLGVFCLDGLPPAPRGVCIMDVTFEIDEDGILSVTAKEKKGKISNSLTIESFTKNLTAGEMKRMIKEGKKMKEDDTKEKDRVMARNSLEQYIYDLEEEESSAKQHHKKAMKSDLAEAWDWLKTHQNASKKEFQIKKEKLTRTWSKTKSFKWFK
ncbi:Heat shock 70 kDa protein BIP2, partial [Linum grandiflorum]